MRSRIFFCQPLFSPALAVALAMMATPALAQTAAPGTLQPRGSASTTPTYTLVHVNAYSGSDTSGDGSQLRPYQTITRALRSAPVNSIVLLAPGEYSEASGEQFPIQLRTGVTVQGSPNSALGQTVIRGTGIFASATGGMVHATLVGADGAGLGHVMVTNTSTAGYGLVIESGRPAIRQNQFVGSGYGGVYVSGNSAPVLEGNQFSHNGVVGLVLDGHTTAEVRGNRFEQTGIGIRVAPGAQPQIANNTIIQNQEGLLLDGSANPILRDNVIAQNRRNGVVEFQVALKAEEPAVESAASILPTPPSMSVAPLANPTAAPELASVSMPAIAPIEVAPPVTMPAPQTAVSEDVPPLTMAPAEASRPSNSLSTPPADASLARSSVQADPGMAPAATLPTLAPPTPETSSTATRPAEESPVVDAPAATLPTVPVLATPPAPAVASSSTVAPSAPATPPAVAPPSDTVLAARESLRRWRQSQSSQGAAATPDTTADTAVAESAAEAVPIAVIPPPTSTGATTSPAPSRPATQLVAAQSSRPAVPAQPSVPASAPNPAPRPTNPDLLPVPSRTIPVGSGGSAIPNLAPPSTALALNGALPPSYGGLLGLVYKVVVPAADSDTQAQVRSVVADAFRVNLDGQTMMQVGAYADEATAEARANELIAQGFEARVEYRP